MNEEKVKEAFRILKAEAPEEWEVNMHYRYCPSSWGLPEENPCIQNCEKCWAAALA